MPGIVVLLTLSAIVCFILSLFKPLSPAVGGLLLGLAVLLTVKG